MRRSLSTPARPSSRTCNASVPAVAVLRVIVVVIVVGRVTVVAVTVAPLKVAAPAVAAITGSTRPDDTRPAAIAVAAGTCSAPHPHSPAAFARLDPGDAEHSAAVAVTAITIAIATEPSLHRRRAAV